MGNKSKYVVDPKKRLKWKDRRNLSASQLPKSYSSSFFGVRPPRIAGRAVHVVRNAEGTGIKHVNQWPVLSAYWPSAARGTYARRGTFVRPEAP